MRLHIYTFIRIYCAFTCDTFAFLSCSFPEGSLAEEWWKTPSNQVTVSLTSFTINNMQCMWYICNLYMNPVLNFNWFASLVIRSICIHSSEYCDSVNETIRFGFRMEIPLWFSLILICIKFITQTMSLCSLSPPPPFSLLLYISLSMLRSLANFLRSYCWLKTHFEAMCINGILSISLKLFACEEWKIKSVFILFHYVDTIPLQYYYSGRPCSREVLLQFHLIFRSKRRVFV